MNIKKIIAALAITASTACTIAAPVPSTFTYQGTLEVDGEPINSDADFMVRLYEGPTFVVTRVFNNVNIIDGQFQLNLNFAPALFDGTSYQLEFSVRSPAGVGSFEVLPDRQPITTTPYAYHANSADTLQTPAVISGDEPTNLVTINQANTSPDVAALRVTRGPADLPLGNFFDRVIEVQSNDTDLGVFSIAGRLPIVGVVDVNSSFGLNAAILGQVQEDVSGTSFALWGLNEDSETEARIATEDFAGQFFGDVQINGNITKDFSPGSFDLATPIAYGFVNSSGSVDNGTPNFSATWNAALLRYEIEIDNESYFFNRYVTVVTPTQADVSVRTGSSGGRLLVTVENTSTQASVQSNFQFITYRTAGAALIQGQQRPPLIPLNTPYTDQELNPNLAAPAPRIPIIIEPTTKSPIQRD